MKNRVIISMLVAAAVMLLPTKKEKIPYATIISIVVGFVYYHLKQSGIDARDHLLK